MSNKPWQVNILTLFPEIFPGPLAYSITGNALKNKIWEINAYQIRDYAFDNYKTVDDTPYGGGNGMVMRADVLANAIDSTIGKDAHIYYLSPKGQRFDQKIALNISQEPSVNLLCGRFEGVDERLFLEYNITQISMGDYVVSAGDVAAIPLLDACIRLLPGALEDGRALKEESFGLDEKYQNLLEYPHYTRPAEWRGHQVPEVLKSGHHAEIEKWRLQEAKKITKIARPDIWDQYNEGEKK
jgi:tRNA (guanine37-N1)-methyltransferase